MVKITEITRQALLDHATDVFAENGFDRAPVREITRRASVNQAAINYHFGGKEALYQEVLRLAVAFVCVEIRPTCPPERPPAAPAYSMGGR
jgi:AcrR family transcriptional regulator